jgi:hypothetical protein
MATHGSRVSGESLDKILKEIPDAIWTSGRPLPYIYRGSPLEMVQQMASEMGPRVTVAQAMELLLKELLRHRRVQIQFHGNPPEVIKAGIFVHTLLANGVCRPMAQA